MVYRGLFGKNELLEISAKQIAKDMGLERADLAVMALFMGSDYTPGVRGIGTVNAVEIINCFGSTKEDLARFREWVDIKS